MPNQNLEGVLLTITLKCQEANCGKEFYLTPNEQRFYLDRGMSLPHRCLACRTKRRESQFAGLKEASRLKGNVTLKNGKIKIKSKN
jgi:hypothetical protein